jgi:hypothetical protein
MWKSQSPFIFERHAKVFILFFHQRVFLVKSASLENAHVIVGRKLARKKELEISAKLIQK